MEPIEPTILHADLDAFFASVEQRDRPELRNRPVLVGGAVVMACSYEAKARGVRSAMNGAQALALCPDAVVVEPRMDAYAEASARVFEVFDQTTPLVEGISIDEAFLDVGGLRRSGGTPEAIARELRRRVRSEIGLPITVGIARTKFLAKVASAIGKPDGLLVVDPTTELEFLHALPVERLWGVGPATAERLHQHGVDTVGDVARLHSSALVAMLGTGPGRHLHALAHNRDPRPVVARARRRSIGAQRALGRSHRSPQQLRTIVQSLVDHVGARLREGNRVGRTLTLRFRYDDFTAATRSATLEHPTASDRVLFGTAKELLTDHLPTIKRQGLTLIGITVANLSDDTAVQLSLPWPGANGRPIDHGERDQAVDRVRVRFGAEALTTVSLLGERHRSMPQLPDPR